MEGIETKICTRCGDLYPAGLAGPLGLCEECEESPAAAFPVREWSLVESDQGLSGFPAMWSGNIAIALMQAEGGPRGDNGVQAIRFSDEGELENYVDVPVLERDYVLAASCALRKLTGKKASREDIASFVRLTKQIWL